MRERLEGRYIAYSEHFLEIYSKKENGYELISLKLEEKVPRAVIRITETDRRATIEEIFPPEIHLMFIKYVEAALMLAMHKMKKEGVQEVRIIDPNITKLPALKMGFRQEGPGLKLTGLQKKKLKITRDGEKTIARYSSRGIVYEIKKRKIKVKTKGLENLITLEDARTGLPVARTIWRRNSEEEGYLYAIKTSIESARMPKTLILYALWEMKKEGIKRVTLIFTPEKGKEKKAETLYWSIGFKRVPGTIRWEMAIEKAKLQKMHLKEGKL